MPFLAIFRKDKDKDSSRSKTPVPLSPAPPSVSSRKSSSFSRARSRPSFASSRSCVSPPPQLANISPASDFDYVLPELDAPSLLNTPAPELAKVPEEPIKPKRALPFGKRRGSASSGMIVSGTSTPVVRPFSEALDSFMARKHDEDRDLDRPRDPEAPTLSDPISITGKNVNVSSVPSTPNTRQTTTTTTSALELDADDIPLVPPPTRASVFGGYAYSDRDRPTRSQSLPDIDQESEQQDDMVRSEHGHSRPSRPQVHPHQLARGKNKSVDLNSLLASSASAPTVAPPAPASDSGAPIKTKQKDASKSGGLFGWRSKSSKEVPAAAQPTPIVTADPADSSFSLKSFRHVGPASSIPSSPVAQPGSAFGSSTNVNSAGISANTSSTAIPSAVPAATVSTPPSSYGRSSPAPGARPVPGRTGVTRERVNSTGSEGVMTAGLFRQAARRSNTNLVEDGGTSPRSSMAMGVRDREKRGPPTRSWADKDGDGSSMSGSDLPPARPPRTRPPEGATSDRSNLGVGHKPQRSLGRSTSAMPSVGAGGDEPSSFANALSQLGEESPLARSGLGQGAARADYAKYGVRSDGALRSVSAAAVPTRPTRPSASTMPQPSAPGPQPAAPGPQPAATRPGHQAGRPSIQSINVRPEMRGVNARPMPQQTQSPVSRPSPPSSVPSSQGSIPRPGPGPQGINSNSSSRPGPQSPQSRPSPQSARSNSPTKPRQSAPTTMGRSPIRTTIPTKTNDGPSIKPRSSSPVKMPRPPSPARSTRSNASNAMPSSPTKSILSNSSSMPLKSSMRQPTSPSHSRYASVDTFRAKSPNGADMHRAKSPSFSVDMTRSRARSPAFEVVSRTKSPAPSAISTRAKSPAPSVKSRVGYVPPPRQSSLAAPIDSDSDESEPDAESESEELGFGEKRGVGALRGRGAGAVSSSSGHGHEGLTRERTITQRTAGTGSGQVSPVRDDQPPKPPAKHGVSLFDRPTPSFDKSSSSSLSDRYGTPPARNAGPGRTRASHSTSAISAAATARNSAAMAEANRRLAGHTRGASTATVGRPSHIRSPAEGTDTDEDEDDKSETDSEDNAPLGALAPPRRPGSPASAAPGPAPSMARSFGRPLVDMSSSNGPPPRPPRRVPGVDVTRKPGVGVTRNSSLRGSRSVEDLGRMTMAPGSVVGGAVRAGPRPFIASPPSSTGDSSSGKAPLTPRDGSEAGVGRRAGSALGPAGDEARRKERRRSEAKASVELGNVINGPGPVDDDNEDGEHMSAHLGQMGPGGMGMMGWNQPGLFPQMTGGFPGFPSSQSMPFGSQFPASQSMPFVPPPPPPGASEAYVAAHQQAMMMAKQAYLSAVAQQAMMFATEQWERSSNAGGSVYGGSQMGGMGMMGGPMMGMYANSAYAASMYEGSVIGGGGAGWGSASAYGGGGGRSAYGGGAKSEYGGGMKSSPTKSTAAPTRNRARAQTATAQTPAPANRDRGNPVPPSTWNTRRKTGGA